MTDTAPPPPAGAPAGDGVYLLDHERRIRSWNGPAAAITGLQAAEVLGHACSDGLLNHVDDDGERLCGSRCPLLATMRDGVERTARVFVHHRDGHLVPVLVRSSPAHGPDGTLTGAVESFQVDGGAVGMSARITELEALAVLDPLTGVGNRRYLDAHLASELEGCDAGRVQFGLMLVDLDHFKLVNDSYGHAAGDAVLRAVAATLRASAGAVDGVARFGGDEFVVIARATGREALEAAADRVRRLVAHTWHRHGHDRYRVTVSIGVTAAHPGDSADSLLGRADRALLESKRHGTNGTLYTG